jgi:hypothetical protein
MLKFTQFIVESLETEKLTHLEHAEDHHVNADAAGFNHAVKTLEAVHHKLSGKESNATITTKYDGSPSIVFGHHPETGKFFVASKSAFNKNPKLNYNAKDVDKNHGHAPGLADKLKTALKHLPKVAPGHGVYQGDLMYTKDDVQEHGGSYHFKPNTITYSSKKDSEEGKKIGKSKMGVVVHTKYEGKNFEDMKAKFAPKLGGFFEHKDVHVMDPQTDHGKAHYTAEQKDKFESHIEKAKALAAKHDYSHLEGHREHVKTYINQTVRTGDKPTVEGLKAHITNVHQKMADKLKTPASKSKISDKMNKTLAHVTANEKHFKNTFAIHHHIQQAKDQLVNALSSHSTYGHSIKGKAAKPEGFVAVIDNKPTKLVDRAEFSRANFEARPR